MSEENIYTFENPEYRQTYWHTCSHVMAQAVKRLWPEVKLAIGPSIDEGWYYDMDAPFAFTPEHLEQIEGEMRKICKEKLKLERFEPVSYTHLLTISIITYLSRLKASMMHTPTKPMNMEPYVKALLR